MIRIPVLFKDVLAVPAMGAYYFDDLSALQSRPLSIAERYAAPPATPGFRRVREVAEAVSIGLVLDLPARRTPLREPDSSQTSQALEGGYVVWGDCVAVEFSGKAGRHPVFRAEQGLTTIRQTLAPALRGRELTTFRELAAEIDSLVEEVALTRPVEPETGDDTEEEPRKLSRRDLFSTPARLLRSDQEEPATEQVMVERRLHTAVRYGASQALLRAAALARGLTMAEVIADEYGLPLPRRTVPIHAQCGADRYAGADKMIARRVASLPHSLVDNIPEHLGEDGEVLVGYARWLRERIPQLAGDDYHPTIHLDVHGGLGQIYQNNLGKILGFLVRLERAAEPFALRVESPLILDSRAAQIEAMRTLRQYLQARKMRVGLVADEWANTLDDIRAFIAGQAADMIQVKMPDLGSVHNSIEAVLACKSAGVGAFLGGSCAETDLSTRAAVHVALATQPDLMLAKPGMGVDEAVTFVQNEIARTLAWIGATNPGTSEQGMTID